MVVLCRSNICNIRINELQLIIILIIIRIHTLLLFMIKINKRPTITISKLKI